MTKVTVPDIEYDLEELEDDDGQKIEGPKKNWFKPAASSMAKLKQIQDRVFNMRLKGASSLKAPYNPQKLTEQHKLTGSIQQHKNSMMTRNLSAQNVTNSDQKHRSPQSASLCRTWGSSSCISELTTRQRKQGKSCPSSAKVRSDSVARVKRLSDTDSVHDDFHNAHFHTVPMTVMGEKKSVVAKFLNPYTLTKNQSHATSDDVDFSHLTQNVIGYLTSSEMNGGNVLRTGLQKLTHPDGPSYYLVSVDKEEERKKASKPQQQHLREPICFCLPSADDENDDDECESNRFLLQADESMESVHRMAEKDDRVIKHLKEARFLTSDQTEISTKCTNINDTAIRSYTTESSIKTTQSKLSDTIDKKVPNRTRGPLTKLKNNLNSVVKTNLESNGHSVLEEKCQDFHGAGDVMNNYQEKPKITTLGNIIVDQSVNNWGCKRNPSNGKTPNFTGPSHGGISKKNDHIPGYTTQTSSVKYQNHIHNNNTVSNHAGSTNSSDDKLDYKPITIVKVNYDDDSGIQEGVSNRVKKGTQNELEVIAPQYSEFGIESHSSATLKIPSTKKNCDERSHTAWSTVKVNDNVRREKSKTSETPPLFKTIKTIEFNHEVPQEITSRCVIHSANQRRKSTVNLQNKQTAQPLQHGSVETEQNIIKDTKKKRSQVKTVGLNEDKDISTDKTNFNSGLTGSMSDLEMKIKTITETFLDDSNEVTPLDKIFKAPKTTERLFTSVQKPTKKIITNFQSTKDIQVLKSNVKRRISSAPKEKPQPFWHGMKEARQSCTERFKSRPTAHKQHKEDSTTESAACTSTKAKPVQPRITGLRTVKSASAARAPARDRTSIESTESRECQDMQTKMAALGIDVSVRALERALYPPSKKPHYHHAVGYLPSDPSYGTNM